MTRRGGGFWMRSTGKPRRRGRRELRFDVLDDLVLVEQPVGPNRDVDVPVEARELPPCSSTRRRKRVSTSSGMCGKPRKLWKPITSRPGPSPSSAASDDEILERVAAGMEVGREAVERHAETRERGVITNLRSSSASSRSAPASRADCRTRRCTGSAARSSRRARARRREPARLGGTDLRGIGDVPPVVVERRQVGERYVAAAEREAELLARHRARRRSVTSSPSTDDRGSARYHGIRRSK